jgi:hypothetical protein
MNKLLRILTAIFAVATAILGFASYAEALPKEYAAVVGLITAVLLGIKEIVVVIGDIADDGVRNDSFKPDGRKLLSVLLLIGLSVSTLCSVGCSQLSVSQRAALAQSIVPLSDLGLSLAQSRGVIQEGDKILIGQGVALIMDDAASTRDKVIKFSALGVQAAVERGVLKEGDALIIQRATAIIQSAADSEVILEGPEPSAPTFSHP